MAYATTIDTVPPAFTDVPPCHIEPVDADAASTTVECKRPTATGHSTLTVKRPTTMEPGDVAHTLEWKGGGVTDTASVSLPVGEHTATWTAADAADNVSTTAQVIVVQDTEPPALTLSKGFRPPPIEATETHTRMANSAAAAGVSTDPGVTLTADPETLPVPKRPRAETVTWRAEDVHGNAATVDTRILVRDTTPPTITCGRPAIVEPDKPSTVVAGLAARVGTSAVDHKLVDPDPVLTADPSTMEPGRRAMTVTWTATDMSSNEASCPQRIWIRDTTPPTITPDPLPPVTIEATGTSTAITAEVAGVAATDSADPNPTITPDKAGLAVGAHTVTWTASDASGNTSEATQQVTVVKFVVTALALRNNGVDITFSRPVDASTTGDILINKWYLARYSRIGAEGMFSTTSTISPANTVVRIEPDLRNLNPPNDNGFCTPHRYSPSTCISGDLRGPWLVSLPPTLTSAQGTALYTGTAPTLQSCAVRVTAHPYWDNRGIANTPGCVGYVNNPYFPSSYTGPAYVIWSDPAPSGSSSQGAQASRFPLQLSASLQAGTDSVMLDWMRGSLPTATYVVERSTDGGAFAAAQVTVLNATRATAPITPADLGSSLSYRMVETAGGVTTRSDPATVTLPTSLEAPSGLSAARSESGTSVALEWRDASIASGYYVERSVAGGAFERIATVTESSHTVELGAAAAGTHEFRVVAYLGSASSPPSATASVTLPSS